MSVRAELEKYAGHLSRRVAAFKTHMRNTPGSVADLTPGLRLLEAQEKLCHAVLEEDDPIQQIAVLNELKELHAGQV